MTAVGVDRAILYKVMRRANLYKVMRRANLYKVTRGAILYKVTFDQRSMFVSHHGLLLLVDVDMQFGFYILSILSLTYSYS